MTVSNAPYSSLHDIDCWVFLQSGSGRAFGGVQLYRDRLTQALRLQACEKTTLISMTFTRKCIAQVLFIAHTEISSCFPIVPKLACEHLGLPTTGSPKPITLLGGLTSFGGAGNNYSMHVRHLKCKPIRAHRY